MAPGLDNSWNLGFCIPTRTPTYENWSGRVPQNTLGSHFTKNHQFLPLSATNIMKNPFFMLQVENP
jgi:hypothetical protein